jgi:hypothetical protein
MRKWSLGLLAVSLVISVIPEAQIAMAAPNKPVIVDSTGKVVGTLGWSDSVEQGVELNVIEFCPPTSFGCPPNGLWILAPWGQQGILTTSSEEPTSYGLPGGRQFFTNSNCQGPGYIAAPRTSQEENNKNHPYSIVMGVGGVAWFPTGTAKSGSSLGIASSYLVGPDGDRGACEPAWATDQQFAPIGQIDLTNGSRWQPPFSISP